MPSAPAAEAAAPACWPRARLNATLVAPWYTPFIYRLTPVLVQGSSELRLRRGWRLEVGDQVSEPELTALLIETCDHLEREHLERRGEREPVAWEQAATAESVSAWSDVLEGELGRKPGFERPRFPRRAIRPELFGLVPHRTAEEYYGYFSTMDDEPLALFGLYGPPSGSSRPHDPEPGRGMPAPGRSSRNEEGEGQDGAPAPAPARVNLAASEAPAAEGEMEAVRNLVRRELGRAEPGTLPGHLLRDVEASSRPAVRWQTELARFLGRTPGRLDYSLLPRPNYGRLLATGALASRLQRGGARTTVVRDTSASMDGKQLARVAAEIRGLAAIGLEFMVADADTRVRALGREVSLARARGGGGTDMLAAAWEAWRLTRPDCLVVLTDGETRWDERSREPPQTIWVILNDADVYVPSGLRQVVRVRSA